MFLALKHFLKIVLPAFLVPGRLHSLFVLKHAHIKNDVVIVLIFDSERSILVEFN